MSVTQFVKNFPLVIYWTRYPLEVHIVHYNRKYKSINEAKRFRDGLAVLAIFAEVILHFIHLKLLKVLINFDFLG